ncbi:MULTISPECIES: restriction endonuclease FokI C-terminal domain-containing protein [unclassified Bacillus (in: firmicutes)]|uniref:restriction endonuclease FokI C-terminal domain-containing protein n=1 Tax=unclassified Bacillus (in: firmicutes) TaxID=185979 RepID=UPI0008E0E8D0|nr:MULTISPECIES: restriction endonuclease FokI C-terminal domain-containing protein [unclassified Bacillus (in: firmicutes)]SFA86437.1 Type-2 restriction enzyme D3 domain-containing protein [Bacillus sp. UNCCL13]SFQ83698.1 Type-2 restriction enzyme D3 domain-containing protein [Bacillus sp. cl95]
MKEKRVIRTFGWVQNPGKFENLKRTVQVFDKDSKVYKEVKDHKIPNLVKDKGVRDTLVKAMNRSDNLYTYKELVGTGTSIRANAPCDAIIQATILDQGNKKGYIDNWSADGFVRWAHALGFIEYEHSKDAFYLTDTGKAYSISSDNSSKEKAILIEALSSYPPAIRILTLLEKGDHLTKFELGKQLGFNGESGFTSLPQDLFLDSLATAPSSPSNIKSSIRSDWEGSADKYARMIAGWLSKMGLVTQPRKDFVVPTVGGHTRNEYISHSYKITKEGLDVIRRAKGGSKHIRVPKRVYWEMLATNITDRVYVRTRRAYTLDLLMKSNSPLTTVQLQTKLRGLGFDELEETIQNDINGLINTGIFIEMTRSGFQLKDTIQPFIIPQLGVTKFLVKGAMEIKKSELRHKLRHVPHEYIELIEIAQDSKQNRLLEFKVVEFFKKIYGYRGKHLGGSRKPDGALFTDGLVLNHGIILDTKAYKDGYRLPISQADEMQRYVDENNKRSQVINPNEWWEIYPTSITDFKFLFVSGFFQGDYRKQLERVSHLTKCQGAVMSVEQLLLGGEKIKEGSLTLEEVGKKFKNDEIVF